MTLSYQCAAGESVTAGTNVTFSVMLAGASTGNGVAVNATTTITPSFASVRPVLRSTGGQPVFIITATGAESLHVLIFGLTIGNAYEVSGQGAILLQHDSWTELSKNIIGASDLPDAIGILMQGSNHPLIHDNTIQGAGPFPFVPNLKQGPNVGGFGVVTAECLGSADRTNGVQLLDNVINGNSNAGVWFCSNGTGGHFLGGNTVLNNGRGLVLWDAVDDNVQLNNVSNNFQDGIDLLNHSSHNLLRSNTVESQTGPTSVGILLAGDGTYFPLGNQLRENLVHRNTVDVTVSGAQGTQFIDNAITGIDGGTGVLFTPGSAATGTSQPINTLMQGNAIQANGTCTAIAGCAIRLAAGTVAGVDASGNNDFGVTDPLALQALIWDHGHDATLGTVYVVAPPPTVTAQNGTLGCPAVAQAAGASGCPTPTPLVTQAPTPVLPSPPPPPRPSPTPAATPAATASATPAAPASTAPIAHLDPATGDYYVAISFCVTDAQNSSVPNDHVSIAFFDQTGAQLGQTNIITDASGCFSGDIAPDAGAGANLTKLPAQIVATDSAGATVGSPVVPGTPLHQPPAGPIQ